MHSLQKKEHKNDDTTEKPKKPKPHPRQPVNKFSKDPNAIRTVIISGLPKSADQKALWKKVRKYDGAESVELLGDGEGVGTFLSTHFPAHSCDTC